MTKPITMIEIFSGIGAQAKALSQLPLEHEVVATMDVEKDAILSYASMRYDLEKEIAQYTFPSKEQMVEELQAKNIGFNFEKSKHTITMKTNIDKIKQYYIADKLSKNLGDVSLQKSLPYVDVIFHSSPCQSFSQAGKGEGGDEGSGTTSSLMWESLRLIETSKPKFVVWENVAAVLSNKHRHNFIKYLERLSEMGYASAFDLLNAKNFGVPQNRLRIFCVSKKVDIADDGTVSNTTECVSDNNQVISTMQEIKAHHPTVKIWSDFIFPEKIPLTTRLKDILETSVDEKYYLPDERIDKILNSTFMQEKKRIQMTDVCDTLLARDWKDPKCVPVDGEPEVRQIGNVCPTKTRDNPNQGRVYDVDGIAPTLTKMDGGNREPMVVLEEHEPFVVASRGRNPENPSDRTTGSPTEQRLEPNFSGCTNTITTVQKDNYVCEPVTEKNSWTETQKKMITEDGNVKRYINSDVVIEQQLEKVAIVEDQFPGSRDARIYANYSPTLRQNCGGLEVAKGAVEEYIKWRIRKLTTKECWRLMGFSDKDHDRAAKFVSASALYKQAGNSICTCCLVALFRSLLCDDSSSNYAQYLVNYNE